MESKHQLQSVSNIRTFGKDVYSIVSKENDSNILFSPSALYSGLAMVCSGMKRSTESELHSCLYIQDDTHTANIALKEINVSLAAKSNKAVLHSANNIFVQFGRSFLPDYGDVLRDYYNTVAAIVDYKSNITKAALDINRWVNSNTCKCIKGVVRSHNLSPKTEMLLVSAVAFKANWLSPFAVTDTVNHKFQKIHGDTCSTPMMSQVGEFVLEKNKELCCTVLELPYEGDCFSMVVLLPDEANGLYIMESKLQGDHFATLPTSMNKVPVEVTIPKINILEGKPNMKDVMLQLNVKTMFDPIADLSGIDGSKSLYLNDIIHKGHIEFTEGTRSPAMKRSNNTRKPAKFLANHSFVFFIRHNKTGCIVFMGRVADPELDKTLTTSTWKLNQDILETSVPVPIDIDAANGKPKYVNTHEESKPTAKPTSGYVNLVQAEEKRSSGPCVAPPPKDRYHHDGYLKPSEGGSNTSGNSNSMPRPFDPAPPGDNPSVHSSCIDIQVGVSPPLPSPNRPRESVDQPPMPIKTRKPARGFCCFRGADDE